MTTNPLVSIIIPTKNGAPTLRKCLNAIAAQTYKKVEVIVIDSGSEDETIAIASDFSFVNIVEIPSYSFNHGTTRNLGVKEAKGEYLLYTVQDAFAVSNDWIETMLEHFLQDREIVGVCGQQIVPHDQDKNPHEWFRPYSLPIPRVVHFPDPKELKALSPKEFYQACGWDNVNAMYRKCILLKVPFQERSFGEDMAWAKEVVVNGNKIVYDFRCRVNHYHHSTYDYTYRRTLTVLYNIYFNFGFVREINYSPIHYLKIIYRNFKYKAEPGWIYFNWMKMFAAKKAYNDMLNALEKGETALQQLHLKNCGMPPQGKQNL